MKGFINGEECDLKPFDFVDKVNLTRRSGRTPNLVSLETAKAHLESCIKVGNAGYAKYLEEEIKRVESNLKVDLSNKPGSVFISASTGLVRGVGSGRTATEAMGDPPYTYGIKGWQHPLFRNALKPITMEEIIEGMKEASMFYGKEVKPMLNGKDAYCFLAILVEKDKEPTILREGTVMASSSDEVKMVIARDLKLPEGSDIRNVIILEKKWYNS